MKLNNSEVLIPVSWQEIKAELRDVNPDLFKLMDEVAGGRNLSLLLAQYPFGCDILRNGTLYLPDEKGGVCPLNEAKVSKALLAKLAYSKIPVGVILNKSVEVYYETQERVISDKLWPKGQIFGLWELYEYSCQEDSAQFSCLSAGARSIFMLPKITDQISHRRLQKNLGIRSPAPASERDQRDLFAEIVAKVEQKNSWRCGILYLTNDWFKNQNSLAFHQMKSYFLQEVWHQSYNCRRQFEINIIWENVLKWMSGKNIYFSPRISSHVKQLHLIAENIFPGMVFANNKENDVAPVELIRDVYKNIYQLKHYDPLLVYSNHINSSSRVYYSLRHPNYFESYIPMKSTPRLAEELSALATVVDLIKENRFFNIDPEFNFYHCDAGATPPILSINRLVEANSELKPFLKQGNFPVNSGFFHGCVEIKKMSKNQLAR